MSGADAALALTALAMLGLRAAGLWVAGALRPDHPFIAWSAAVSQATLAAFVVLAVIAPTGALAGIPAPARLAALVAGLAVFGLRRGRGLLGALAAGLAVLVAVRWLAG